MKVRVAEACPKCGAAPVGLYQVWRGAADAPGGVAPFYYVECHQCGARGPERRDTSAAVQRFKEGRTEWTTLGLAAVVVLAGLGLDVAWRGFRRGAMNAWALALCAAIVALFAHLGLSAP